VSRQLLIIAPFDYPHEQKRSNFRDNLLRCFQFFSPLGFFIFEPGMLTSGSLLAQALRMRVSISAMGSVIMGILLLFVEDQ
jgi:hypothetical protein